MTGVLTCALPISTEAEVENADAVVEAIEDETATAADAPEAEEAKKD